MLVACLLICSNVNESLKTDDKKLLEILHLSLY